MAPASTSFLSLVQSESRPGIIDLGVGQPDPALLPVDEIRQASAGALARYGPDALAYGYMVGPAPLIARICGRLAGTDDRAPRPDEVCVTGGNSQALDHVATLFTQPGDVALVEAPTYHLALDILRDHSVRLVGVPTDAGGLDVEALASAIVRLRGEGKRVRLLYSVPTFHNPTGRSLADDRRRALVELADREDLLVVEDDVYRELAYDDGPPPSLWSLARPGRVIRLGSFAKSLAPGLRLGYLTADAATVARFADSGLLNSGGCVNQLGALVVAEYFETGRFAANVTRLQAAYRERRDALLAALTEFMPPGASWETPRGGYFVWLRMGEGLDASRVMAQAEAAGTSFQPAAVFFPDADAAPAAARLAFSRYGPAELREAARRLGGVMAGQPGSP